MRLGRGIAIDVTPLESIYGDEDSGRNGHWDPHMNKIHNVVYAETGLSIVHYFSPHPGLSNSFAEFLIGVFFHCDTNHFLPVRKIGGSLDPIVPLFFWD